MLYIYDNLYFFRLTVDTAISVEIHHQPQIHIYSLQS